MEEKNLQNEIEESLKGCVWLEDAAQQFANVLYEKFKDTIVLSRVFMTVPYKELPLKIQEFVKKLVTLNKVDSKLNENTLVLTLLGSRGELNTWNSRLTSKGHVGIPLVSRDFIDEIPMMSRLLKELNLNLDWIEKNDTEIVLKAMGQLSGLFYVRDAATAVDNRGRKIIAAQDFVSAHNVKTVFGFGGGYILKPNFVVVIIFTRKIREKNQVEPFLKLLSVFKTMTTKPISEGKILKV